MPFYSSILVIISMPLLVFFSNVASVFLFGMEAIDKHNIDKLFHILGGIAISLSVTGIFVNFSHRNIMTIHNNNVFRALVLGGLCFFIICWEILEYFVHFAPEYLTYSDTIVDMVCGLIGGLFAMMFIRRPICNRQKR